MAATPRYLQTLAHKGKDVTNCVGKSSQRGTYPLVEHSDYHLGSLGVSDIARLSAAKHAPAANLCKLPAVKPSDTSVTFGVLHASAIVTFT
jgi:hypothetical protein